MKKGFDWNESPNGIISWILWSLPPKTWKIVIWCVGLFIALTAIAAFFQLLTIRQSTIEKIRSDFFEEQWARDNSSEWKIGLMKTWHKPWEIPEGIWSEIVSHKDNNVRKIAASLDDLPDYFRNVLLNDKDFGVRIIAILNSKRIKRCLYEETNQEIKKEIASSHFAPIDILKKYAEDQNEELKRIVASNPKTPESILRKLAKNKSGLDLVKWEIATNVNTPPGILSEFAESQDLDILIAVANNQSSTKKILEKLSFYPDDEVKHCVASNPNSPKHVLDELIKDPSVSVRRGLALNLNIPEDISLKLAKDQILVQGLLAENNQISNSALDELLKIPDVKENLVRNSKLTKDQLKQLVTTGDESIWLEVALNKNVSREILEEVYGTQTKNEDILAALASNPQVPRDILEDLSKNKSIDIRAAAAGNPNASVEMLKRIADSKDKDPVRAGLACNSTTPPEILTTLAKDAQSAVRECVAKHPGIPLGAVNFLAGDTVLVVRKEIAKNGKTSVEWLKRLIHDNEQSVVIAAFRNLYERNKGYRNQ